MKLLAVVSLLVGLVVSEPSMECKEMFMSYKHPYSCCKYPMRKILDKAIQNCKSKCATSQADTDCCILNCNYRETGVIFNGDFNDQAFLKLYENYLEDHGAGKYDKWMTVIEKSIKKCETMIPKTDKMYACSIPEFVMEIIDCVNLMNYLECPTFVRSAECQAAQDMLRKLDKCGKKRNGTVLVEPDYWNFELIDPKLLKSL